MQLASIYIPLSLASLMLSLPAAAFAAEALDGPAPTSRIVGGEESSTCHFPSTVSLGGCTGTLVHPRIVVTANHCLSADQEKVQVVFGEKSFARYRVNASCKAMNGGNTAPRNGDFAYCKLDRAVNDVPIVPVLMGCELAALKKAQEVVLVGFGLTSANNKSSAGTKRQVITPLHDAPGASGAGDNEVLIGHASKGACFGDSGGPAFINLANVEGFKDKPGAGWRVFGVTSGKGPGGEPCASTSIYGLLSGAVEWIEQDSGIDITPCFDGDGTWMPGETCKHFPDPQAGGSWTSCDAGTVGPVSQVCGGNPLAPDDSGSTGSQQEDSTTSEGTTQESSDGSSDSTGDTSSESGAGKDSTGDQDSSADDPPKHDSPNITPEQPDSKSKESVPQKQGSASGCAIQQKDQKGALLLGVTLGLLGWRRRRA